MKRKISFLLAVSMLFTSASFTVAHANTFESFYADVNGVAVKFTESVTAGSIEGYTLKCGETLVTTQADIRAEDDTVVNLIPQTDLEIDKVYTLNIAGQEKQFKIKKLFAENFDSYQDSVITQDLSKTNDYGDFKLELGEGEAFLKDGKLAFTNATFKIVGINNQDAIENVTFSADIEGYGKKYEGRRGEVAASSSNVVILMNSNVSNIENNDSLYAFNLSESTTTISSVASGGASTNSAAASYGENGETFGFSILTNENIALGDSYTYTDASAVNNVGIRTTQDNVSGFFGNKELGRISDTSYRGGYYSINADNKGLAVIDNVMVTYCTEDVIDPEVGEVKATELKGDFTKLQLYFDRTLHGTNDFSKITVYEDNVAVSADIKLNTEDEKILDIIPQSYTSGHTYKVVVAQDFGTNTMWTYQDYSFELELKPKELKVKDAVIDHGKIILTLDSVINITNAAQKIKAYEDNIEITPQFKVEDDKITITPAAMTYGKTYKIVASQGLGDANTYLFADYEFSQLLTKTELKVESVAGGTGVVKVVFNEDISTVSNIADYIKVFKDDVEQTISCAIDKNELNITISDFLADTIYELSIEKGIENEDVVLKNSFLKKFRLRTVITEDFEEKEPVEGEETQNSGLDMGSTRSKTIDVGGNNKRAVYNARWYITNKEVADAENVVVSFDYQIYAAHYNYNNFDSYTYMNGKPPYNYWDFNMSEAASPFNDGYRVYLQPDKIEFLQVKNKDSGTKLGSPVFHEAWKFGDGYYDKDTDEFTFFKTGDIFPKELADKYGVEASIRDVPPVYKIEFVKNAESVTIKRDGVIIYKFKPEEKARTNGYFSFLTQSTNIAIFDNIDVKVLEVIEDEKEATVASSLTLNTSDLTNVQNVSGSFNLKNYSDTDKDIRAIVIAYGDNNKMIGANILSIDKINAGSVIQAIPFTLTGIEGTKRIDLLLIDTLNTLGIYDTYGFN